MPSFEAELTTTFSKIAAQGERLKNTFNVINEGNRRAVRDYVATLQKAQQIRAQQFAREFRTDQGLSNASAVARMNAAIDAQQAAAFRRASTTAPAAGPAARGVSGRAGARVPGSIAGIEGPIGRFASRALGAAGVDVANIPGAGAAVAGGLVVARALLAIDAQRVAMAKQVLGFEQQRESVIRAATERQQDQAAATADRLGTRIESLIARGGSGAFAQAQELATKEGRPLADAIDAMLAARNIRGVSADRALSIARIASRTGEVGLSEAVAGIGADPGLRLAAQSAAPGSQAELSVAARIIARQRGSALPSRAELGAITGDLYAAENIDDPIVRNLRRQRQIRSQTELAGVTGIEAGENVASAMREMGTAFAPVATALGELNRNQEAMRATLVAAAEAQGAFAAGVQNFLMLMGGEGSAEQQRRRFDIARGRSLTPNAPGR